MKKLNLNFQNKGEVLTRDQLKEILGGEGSGSGSGITCKCQNGNTYQLDCSQTDAQTCALACYYLC